MNIAMNARAALFAVTLCTGAGAPAALLPFSGNATATASGFPDSSCAPQLFRQSVAPGGGSGTSSFGNFGYTSTTCVTPGGPVSGVFAINFESDGFQGMLNGSNSPTDITNIFSPNFTYTIQSGTGRFLDATGTFVGTGSIDARGRPTFLTLAFNGQVNAPAVPEPASWSMMLVGFAGVGWSMRRRQRRKRGRLVAA